VSPCGLTSCSEEFEDGDNRVDMAKEGFLIERPILGRGFTIYSTDPPHVDVRQTAAGTGIFPIQASGSDSDRADP
jgi:hypothetical protein